MNNKLINILRVVVFGSAFAISAGAGVSYADVNTTASNDLTGPRSRNRSEVTANSNTRITINNRARLDNDARYRIETGQNRTSNNTLVGNQATGDANISVTFDNTRELNANVVDLGLTGASSHNVDFSGSNFETGPFSDNRNIVRANRNFNLRVNNNSSVDNDLNVNANTGRNRTTFNTSVGDIQTGDVSVNANFDNTSNILGTGTANFDLGSLNTSTITTDFSNQLTGPNSENINRLNSDSRTNININDNSRVDNDINVRANTGNNNVSYNTSVGDVSTGSVTVDVSVIN